MLVERAGPNAGRGYMLGLLPLVHPVLDVLGLRTRYIEESVPVDRHRVRDRRGQTLREYRLDQISDGEGGYRGITRGGLLELLSGPNTPVYRTTVTALDQRPEAMRARLLTDGQSPVEADFDLVVGTDGLYSATRGLLSDPDALSRFDAGFAGWVGWCDGFAQHSHYEETWGRGFFVGTYPVPGRLGVFVGGDRRDLGDGPAVFIESVLRREPRLPDPVVSALRAVAAADSELPYLWPMEDRRVAHWVSGRAVLIGDAAVGFLPTAGLGAAMAMESAGVLAARIADARPHEVPDRLAAFEIQQRNRVQRAQEESRRLARLMFRSEPLVTALRDAAVRAVPERIAMAPLRRLVQTRPEL